MDFAMFVDFDVLRATRTHDLQGWVASRCIITRMLRGVMAEKGVLPASDTAEHRFLRGVLCLGWLFRRFDP